MARFQSDRKVQEWRRRLARFEESQHSINAFCRQERISPQSFYHWRKRLGSSPASRPGAVPAPLGFRPVRILPTSGVNVQLPGGTQLVVPTTDPASLQLVIETVARADARRAGEIRPC